MISYHVELADLHAHLYRVTLTVPRPAPQQQLSLPVWIPGSYMVREFGRHLSQLEARQGREARPLKQLDKTTWEATCSGNAALVVSCLVYAFDTSVRTAFLGADRGFFNGTSLCLRVHGREQQAHQLTLGALPRGWQVATAMPAVPGRARAYVAADYDELVDHPFELGAFWRGRFEAGGVPHEFVVAGAWPGFDGERLLADARRICEAQIDFWHGAGPAAPAIRRKGAVAAAETARRTAAAPRHGATARASTNATSKPNASAGVTAPFAVQPPRPPGPPFHRYVFLLNTVDDGYGGLEHRASTALIAARRDLPRSGQAAGDGYTVLLGLISHEYFHTWNVKRLKPRDFTQFDYTRENYTGLLWFFEGFTSYYDDLVLVRSGLIDEARYLGLLGKTLSGVRATPGRKVQSVAQASFDAWVKYYRADENTVNATVSYYTLGSLVALALDLSMRQGGRGTLDDVMRMLWQRSQGGPIDEDDIVQAVDDASGRPLGNELRRWVHGTDDLPLEALLTHVGVTVRRDRSGLGPSLGLRVAEGALTGVQVKAVLRGGAAERAGVYAGDELLAVNGWRVRRLDDAQQWLAPGEPLQLLLVRDQRLRTVVVAAPDAADDAMPRTLSLVLADKPTKAATALRRAWLTG
jgi:predicted metalloprotease with PDZ domain